MSNPCKQSHSRELDRYDLTGKSFRKWRVPVVAQLTSKLKGLFGKLYELSKKTPPGADQSVAQQAKEASGKLLKHVDAKLEEMPLENELRKVEAQARQAETAKAFAEAELAREQAKHAKVETAHRTLDLYERLKQLTDGKPLPVIVDQDGHEVIVVADILKLLEQAKPSETAE